MKHKISETVVEGAPHQLTTTRAGSGYPYNQHSFHPEYSAPGHKLLTVVSVYSIPPKPKMKPSDTPGVIF